MREQRIQQLQQDLMEARKQILALNAPLFLETEIMIP